MINLIFLLVVYCWLWLAVIACINNQPNVFTSCPLLVFSRWWLSNVGYSWMLMVVWMIYPMLVVVGCGWTLLVVLMINSKLSVVDCSGTLFVTSIIDHSSLLVVLMINPTFLLVVCYGWSLLVLLTINQMLFTSWPLLVFGRWLYW